MHLKVILFVLLRINSLNIEYLPIYLYSCLYSVCLPHGFKLLWSMLTMHSVAVCVECLHGIIWIDPFYTHTCTLPKKRGKGVDGRQVNCPNFTHTWKNQRGENRKIYNYLDSLPFSK